MAAAFPQWLPGYLSEPDKHRVLHGERQALATCADLTHGADVIIDDAIAKPQQKRPGRPTQPPDPDEINEIKEAAQAAAAEAARATYRDTIIAALEKKPRPVKARAS